MKRILKKVAGYTLLVITVGGFCAGVGVALGHWWALPVILATVAAFFYLAGGLAALIGFLLRDN